MPLSDFSNKHKKQWIKTAIMLGKSSIFEKDDGAKEKLQKAQDWYRDNEEKMTDETRAIAINKIAKLEDELIEESLK